MGKLGQLLVARGWITVQQLTRALTTQSVVGGRLGTCLLEMDALSEDLCSRASSEQHGVPAVSRRRPARHPRGGARPAPGQARPPLPRPPLPGRGQPPRPGHASSRATSPSRTRSPSPRASGSWSTWPTSCASSRRWRATTARSAPSRYSMLARAPEPRPLLLGTRASSRASRRQLAAHEPVPAASDEPGRRRLGASGVLPPAPEAEPPAAPAPRPAPVASPDRLPRLPRSPDRRNAPRWPALPSRAPRPRPRRLAAPPRPCRPLRRPFPRWPRPRRGRKRRSPAPTNARRWAQILLAFLARGYRRAALFQVAQGQGLRLDGQGELDLRRLRRSSPSASTSRPSS